MMTENLSVKKKAVKKNSPQSQAGSDPRPIRPFRPKISDRTPIDKSDLIEIIAALHEEGVTLSIEDGALRVTGDLKPGMAAVIERHRSALVALLQEGEPC